MVTRLDRYVGEILKKLDELGLADNTIVLFSSDNGPHREGGADPDFFNSAGSLTGCKRDLYEGGIRVPLVVRWPGKIPAGTVTDHISAFWDVLPTLAEVADAECPPGIDGVSFLPTLLGHHQPDDDRFLYWEFNERGFNEQAARRGRWKAIRHDPRQPLELYDLGADEQEKHNVAKNNPAIVAEFQEFLDHARTPSTVWPLTDR